MAPFFLWWLKLWPLPLPPVSMEEEKAGKRWEAWRLGGKVKKTSYPHPFWQSFSKSSVSGAC